MTNVAMRATRNFISGVALITLVISFDTHASGVSGSIDQSLEETYWIGAVGSRKAADNLFRNAINDAQRGLSSFPPNVGLLVRAAKQGVRGYDADQQSRAQANWAMKAMDTESSTSSQGFQSDRKFTRDHLQNLANTRSPYSGFIKEKLGQVGVQVDERNSQLVGPGGISVPLGMSNQQMSDMLGRQSDSNIAAVLQYGAEQVFGMKSVPGLTNGVAGWIKGKVQSMLLSDDGSVDQAVNQAMAEAKAELDQMRKARGDEGGDQSMLAANDPEQEPPAPFAADGELVDPELETISELSENEDSFNREPSAHRGLATDLSSVDGFDSMADDTEAKERIGLISYNIFNMISRRYMALQVQRRLINEDENEF